MVFERFSDCSLAIRVSVNERVRERALSLIQASFRSTILGKSRLSLEMTAVKMAK